MTRNPVLKSLLLLVLLVALCIPFTGCGSDDEAPGTVTGHVVAPSAATRQACDLVISGTTPGSGYTGVAGVTVELWLPGATSATARTVTGADGSFTISAPAGTYTLRATLGTCTVEVAVTMTAGQTGAAPHSGTVST